MMNGHSESTEQTLDRGEDPSYKSHCFVVFFSTTSMIRNTLSMDYDESIPPISEFSEFNNCPPFDFPLLRKLTNRP